MALLLYLALISVPAVQAWVNDWDRPVAFVCPRNQYITRVASQHNNKKEDRLWDFTCSGNKAKGSCFVTGYLNDWDAPLHYNCPGKSVLSGMFSEHDNHKEDRRFKFYCCDLREDPHDCHTTGYINSWDGHMNYVLPPGKAIKGMYSHHSNKKEDRLWKLYVCRV